MKVSGFITATGKEFQGETNSLSSDFLKFLADFEISEEGLTRLIDGLDISADAKSLLFRFSKATINAGQHVIKLGRKIIDLVCIAYREYPSATFGVIFGAIAGLLISSVPIIGVVLGPIFTPILTLLGLGIGMWKDIKDEGLKRKVTEINASFAPLETR